MLAFSPAPAAGGSGIVVLRWDTTTGYDILVSGGSVITDDFGDFRAISFTDPTA